MIRRNLTLKQRKFGLAFVGEANGNGVESARLAGYRGNDVTLAAVAHENLRKPQIASFIEQLRRDAEKRAGDKILSATEVLVGLTKIAEADLAEVFEPDGRFDLQSAKKRGVSRLIKSMKFDKDSGILTHIELHNAHGAHVDLGKYHKLFTDKLELSGVLTVDDQRQQLAEVLGIPPEQIPIDETDHAAS